MSTDKKVSDDEFFAILRENAGLFARTALAIKTQFKIDYSRQAVRERALNNPEELADIKEQNIDVAEEGLHSLMRSKNEHIKLKACETFLKTIGKDRGYNEKLLIDHTTKGEAINKEKTVIVFKKRKKK